MIVLHEALVQLIAGDPYYFSTLAAYDGRLAVFTQEPVPGSLLKGYLASNPASCFAIVGPTLSDDWLEQKQGPTLSGPPNGLLRTVQTQVRFYAPMQVYTSKTSVANAEQLIYLLHKQPAALVMVGATALTVDVAGTTVVDTEHLWGALVTITCMLSYN